MTTEATTETTPARFALHGDAPEWLARYMTGEEIPDTWSPSGDYDGATICGMTYEAAGQGIITAPDGMTVEYEYTPDGDDGGGFRWLLYTGQSYRSLRIASPYQRAWRIGEYDAYGADAALLVLQNAVEWANNLLDDLAAHVAAQTPDVWGTLCEAADDQELVTLEEIGVRAGVIWRCEADRGDGESCGWIARADETECGDGMHPRPAMIDAP